MSGVGNAVCRCGRMLDEPADLPRSERRPCPVCESLVRKIGVHVELPAAADGSVRARTSASEHVELHASSLIGAAAFGTATLTITPPALTLKALLDFGGRTDDGQLVRAVAVPWFEIVAMMLRDPAGMYQIDPRKWEEVIAGAYARAGFDEVILTPRSGDGGKDVIATKWGIGSIRIFDDVKAYSPGRVVKATEVRAMVGTITGSQNVSKGVITTTSEFAPGVFSDPSIAPLIPFQLELRPRDPLLAWLAELSKGSK